VAAVFASLGIWLAQAHTTTENVWCREVAVADQSVSFVIRASSSRSASRLATEILQLIAEGLSNREIAARCA